MPDVQVENFLLATSNDQSSGIWKITRAMKTAGWRYKASSDATTQDVTGNPNNDKWGAGVQVGAQTATVSFTIGAPTTTAYGGRSTISGLTGFATTSVGHFLKITGATNSANNGTWLITKFISATSVVIENPAAVSETTPGTATWTELSALLDTFPALGAGAWWCGQGPSTMKVPIGTAVPSGTGFIRGENVTQTTSGATGEVLGVVTDSGGQGYLVIAPRLSGTGGGPRGWSTNLITGSLSGATVTPTATVIEFVREIVFWRSSTTAGHIYFQVIDQASEAAVSATGTGRFSTMASSSLTTIAICPGGATGLPTTNGFPLYGSYVPLGQGGSGAVATGANTWVNSTVAVNLGRSQILLANAIEDANISPDGTIIWAAGTPGTGTTTFIGWALFRLDEQEDGDVDPYIWFMYDNRTSNSRTRLLGNSGNTTGDLWQSTFIFSSGTTPWIGWRRRGYQSGGTQNGDSWVEMQAWAVGATTSGFAGLNTGTPETVACSFVTTKVRDPIIVANWYVLNNIPLKIRKGSLRWMYMIQGNAGCDTYDNKRWIQLSSTVLPFVIGPADGTTTPTNQ